MRCGIVTGFLCDDGTFVARFPADDPAPWVKHDRGGEGADLRRAGQLL
jgi:hypothetical protein